MTGSAMLRTPNTASARAKTVAPPRSVPTLDSSQSTASRRLRAISTWGRDRRSGPVRVHRPPLLGPVVGRRIDADSPAPACAAQRVSTLTGCQDTPARRSRRARQRLRSLSEMPDLRLVPKPELDRLRAADVDPDAQARAARRRVPAERARRRQARRLGAPRLDVQRARRRRAPPLRRAGRRRARLRRSRPRRLLLVQGPRRARACTRRSSRSVSCRGSVCSASAASAASTGTRTSACPGSRRARARSGWASRRGAGSRSRSAGSAATGGSS